VEKVYEVKRRPRDKGLTTIVDSLETAQKYAELSESEKKIVKEFMPGPLTLVAEKKIQSPIISTRSLFSVSHQEK